MAPPKAHGQQGQPSGPGNQPNRPPNTKSSATAPRSVVPAIPLPLIPKQSNPGHSKKDSKNGENSAPASSLEAALINHSIELDGSAIKSTQGMPEFPEQTATTIDTRRTTSSPDGRPADEAGNGIPTNGWAGPLRKLENGHPAYELSSEPRAVMAGPNGAKTLEGSHNGDLTPMARRPQPDAAPVLDYLGYPPGFPIPMSSAHPPRNQILNDRHADNCTMNAPPPMPPMYHPQHHQHMSNGNIMFGGFPESHTPSPATAGGFMPPSTVNGEGRNLNGTNGHHPSHSTNNGFPAPINTQARPGMHPVAGMDNYGHGLASGQQTPFENYHPGNARFGPPTPHSFHGSHGSGEPNGIENGARPFLPPNGAHFPGLHPHEHPNGLFPPFPPLHNPEMMMDNPMEGVSYLRNQFDNGELADCVLELVHLGGHHHPVKITGHKLILGRSPTLKQNIMAALTKEMGCDTITIESTDRYLRNNAWWMAIQRLYMHPLLTLPPITANSASGINFAGDKNDRLEFCLGYAAAGRLLGLSEVLVRGLQIASDLVSWGTVEEALVFVFDGSVQRHTDYGMDQDGADIGLADVDFNYGRETKILLDSVVNFLINAFPPNFELDTTVSDYPRFSRIPGIPPDTPVRSPTNGAAPTIARGTTTRITTKSGRLGNIKFGDLPAALPSETSEDESAEQRQLGACASIVSRILLNLPFDELRAVMTSNSHSSSSWNTAEDRYRAVVNVIAAREARRLRAVEVVRAGLVPYAYQIQQRLSSPRRHATAEAWDILNWQEELILPRGAKQPPLIVRKWVPQFADPGNAELSHQPIYDTSSSMV